MRHPPALLSGRAGTSTTLAGVPRTPAASLIQGGSKANAIALPQRGALQEKLHNDGYR